MPGMENLGLRWRQIRFNPLRSLTPSRLASALDSHAAGWLRDAALIFEMIEQREAIVRSVMTKRRAAVARRDWQVVTPDPDHPKAEAHKATLEYFYNNLSVTDATDLNVRTGMSGLLRQMMDAVIQRHAVHEIVWKPGDEGLTAELRRVPLYFFENRSGRLRFIGPETRADGTPLEEDGWMITVADGLGEALSICYMFKRLAIQDLIAFSEKFSVPGILGRTKAAKGSPEGNALRDSVLAYASEWIGVNYSDDGTIKDPIQTIQTPGGATLPPMTIAEYMDRMIATLVRGGDASTIMKADGTGSSVQQDETDALLEDDCALVSETLQIQLDRVVIRMVHGDEQPAAYVVVNPPSNQDLTSELAIDEGLSRLGVVQDPEDIAERYGREVSEKPETEDDKTQDTRVEQKRTSNIERSTLNAEGKKEEEVLALANEEQLDEIDALRAALTADLQPLGEALAGAMQAGDFAAMQAALKKISAGMADHAESPAVEALLSGMMAEAWLGDDPAEVAGNGDLPGHPFRGNQWPNRPKGTGKPKKAKGVGNISEVLDAAFADPDNRDFTDYAALGEKEIAGIEARAGRTPAEVGSLEGLRRSLEAEKAMKILSKHAADKYPVTEEDFHSLPSYLASPSEQKWETKRGQTPKLISTVRRGRDLLIIEEVQTGNRRLTVLSMYRP